MTGVMGPLYNPALLQRQQLVERFVVREPQLRELEALIRRAPADAAPQHALVIGWRGMGKTTLLHRLAYLVEDDAELSTAWLPVLFDEEQYNVGDLADFWLNALRMVAEASGNEGYRRRAETLLDDHGPDELEEAARRALHDASVDLDRRLLLLVDNFDALLDRVGGDVQHTLLREVLQHEPWLMLIGASSQAIEATYDYGRPLYDQLTVIELEPLSPEDTLNLLRSLADHDGSEELVERIGAEEVRIRKLGLLIGGNPRTASLLYGLWKEGPRGDLRTKLESLLDQHTSLYKDRVERLGYQTQRVFDALAQRWEAATAEEIATELRLERAPVSSQLTRLMERGLVERVDIGQRAVAYQVKERFFNLWCLMRGSRRSRQRLRWLAEWIELFYSPDDITAEARRLASEMDGLTADDLQRALEVAGLLTPRLPEKCEKATLLEAMIRSGTGAGLFQEADASTAIELILDLEGPSEAALGLAEALNNAPLSDADSATARGVSLFRAGTEASMGLTDFIKSSGATLGHEALRDRAAEVSAVWMAFLDVVRSWPQRDGKHQVEATALMSLASARLFAGDPAGTFDAWMEAAGAGYDNLPWSVVVGYAFELGQVHRLRNVRVPSPEQLTAESRWDLLPGLVSSGHEQASAYGRSILADPPANIVQPGNLAAVVLAGTPGAPALAREKGIPLPWNGLVLETYRLRGAAAAEQLAREVLMDVETHGEHASDARLNAALLSISTGRTDSFDALEASLAPRVSAVLATMMALLTREESRAVRALRQVAPVDFGPADPSASETADRDPAIDLIGDILGPLVIDPDMNLPLDGPLPLRMFPKRAGSVRGALAAYRELATPAATPALSGLALREMAESATEESTLLEVAGLAHLLAEKAPGPWQVHGAIAAAEAKLGRGDAAARALRYALGHFPEGMLRFRGQSLLDLCIDIARVAPSLTLTVLEDTGYVDRFLGLADALRIRLDEPPDHLLRLPPERRALAEDVLAELQASERSEARSETKSSGRQKSSVVRKK